MTFACAQECARPIVAIGMLRIVELIASQSISGEAAVFQTGVIGNPPPGENRTIRKCLRIVYLQTRGEVAERLKAAVC